MATALGTVPDWRISLLDEQREAVGNHLQSQLVELIDLGLQAKQAHWTVRGPHFRSLHRELDKMADGYRRVADEVAERMAAIGVWPDGQVGEVARNTVVQPLPVGPIEDTTVVEVFAHRVEAAALRARARAVRLGELDLISQDLVIGITRELEKQSWMLHAQKGKASRAGGVPAALQAT